MSDLLRILKRYLPALVLAIFGILLSIYGYFYAAGLDVARAYDYYNRWADERLDEINHNITRELDRLNTVSAYFDATSTIEKAQFDLFVQQVTGEKSTYQAIEWIPVVPREKRASFEREASRAYQAPFGIKERDADGNMMTAGQRDFYYPVYFVYPLEGNAAAVGFDLGSNAARLAALEQARDSGVTVATPRISLVQLKKNNLGILLFTPVYKHGHPVATVEQRRQHILGFVLGVMRVTDMIDEFSMAPRYKPAGIDVYLFDLTNEQDSFMYVHSSRIREKRDAPVLSFEQATQGLHSLQEREIGTRTWALVTRPVDPEFTSSLTNQRWFLLYGGLFCTLIIVIQLVFAARRRLAVENLVIERTRQLEETINTAKQEEMRLRAVLENSAEGIITIDGLGNITSANAAAQSLFGYSLDELLGKNISMLIPPDERSAHDKYLAQSQLHASKVINQARELFGYRKDGHRFPMELNVSAMTLNGQRAYIGLMRDISERKKVEVRKTEFISTVSHELRTPLTSIKGSLGLVLSGAFGELPEKVHNLVEIANVNCERQIALVNDLLDMEKIFAGKMQYQMKPIFLNDVVLQSLVSNAGYGEKYGVKFELVGSIVSAKVFGDTGRLIQVMSNLLSNAAKFSPKDGVVEVMLREENGTHYRVSVRDFGAGIPDAFRKNIFDRFSQADSSDTRQKGGTGLGLSISKAIITDHQGHIDFESVEGKGATFYFTLPKYNERIG
ncbi:MAG: CHASE domain-containing protein [Gammaproteobacteria bacterium]|nr:CHASE domain-containing protein [Gammaproteobacteria bacterium]